MMTLVEERAKTADRYFQMIVCPRAISLLTLGLAKAAEKEMKSTDSRTARASHCGKCSDNMVFLKCWARTPRTRQTTFEDGQHGAISQKHATLL